jgi:hypothetical protein
MKIPVQAQIILDQNKFCPRNNMYFYARVLMGAHKMSVNK